MSKYEITEAELDQILENAHKQFAIQNKDVSRDKETYKEIITGLLRNRVMTGAYFYSGLVNDIFDLYPETIKFLAQKTENLTRSQVITQLSDEIRNQASVSESSWKLELKFDEQFIKLGLLSQDSGNPNNLRSNIKVCHNEFVVPRSIAMNYLKENINAIKSAYKSLSRFHDSITGHKLPLVIQCITGARTTCFRLTPQGKRLWQHLKRYIGSDEADSLKKIYKFQELIIVLQNFKYKINLNNNELSNIINDLNFRLRLVNREKYPPKNYSKYLNQLKGILNIQENQRISEEGEYNFQRTLTTLEALNKTYINYDYLRDIRSWMNLTKNEFENFMNVLKANLRMFSSIRSEDDFKEKLEYLETNINNIREREILVYEVVEIENWIEEVDSNHLIIKKNVHNEIIKQSNDLPENKSIIQTEWIKYIAEAFSNLQKDHQDQISHLEELEINE